MPSFAYFSYIVLCYQVSFSNTAQANPEEDTYQATIILGSELYTATGNTVLEAKKRASARALMETVYQYHTLPERLQYFNERGM